MTILLPLRTVSEANVREHWARRARRAREQRMVARAEVSRALRGRRKREQVRTVTLTRLAPRSLDSDNLVRALKAIRDGVADALGVDDGEARVTWCYEQERSREAGVRVTCGVRGEET